MAESESRPFTVGVIFREARTVASQDGAAADGRNQVGSALRFQFPSRYQNLLALSARRVVMPRHVRLGKSRHASQEDMVAFHWIVYPEANMWLVDYRPTMAISWWRKGFVGALPPFWKPGGGDTRCVTM